LLKKTQSIYSRHGDSASWREPAKVDEQVADLVAQARRKVVEVFGLGGRRMS